MRFPPHPPRLRALTVGAAVLALVAPAVPALAVPDPDPGSVPAPRADEEVQLQARTNLLVNDDGFNLPPGSSFNSITPDLNDAGQVAFRVQYAAVEGDPTTGTPGLWLGGDGEGGIVTRGDTDGLIPNDVSLADTGDVALTLSGGGVENQLFRYDGEAGELTQVGTSPVLPNTYGTPRLAEDGTIGFQAVFGQGRALASAVDGVGRFLLQDGALDPDSPYGYVFTPDFNDAGTVAVKVGYPSDLAGDVEILAVAPGSEPTTLLASQGVDPESPWSRFDNSLALADDGAVAVVGQRTADGVREVLLVEDGEVTPVAAVGEDGLAGIDFFAPDVNDAGHVVFRGVDADGQAVFVWSPESGLERVIGDGDEVETDLGTAQLGQHDTSPVFGGAPRINEAGDISFTAGVHPAGDDQTEWGSGVFVAYAPEGEPEPVTPQIVRLDGTNRYVTAATAALERYADGAPVVYVTTGADYPDALTASALAGSEGGPVLLTRSDLLTEVTRATLLELDPERVVVVGGRSAVQDGVVAALESATGLDVERIEGAQRFATAARVAERFEDPSRVYVATGRDYPDALAAGARAGAQDVPVLLVDTDRVPLDTREVLAQWDLDEVVVLGGRAVVEPGVITELAALTGADVERVEGDDRYGTAAALAGEIPAGEADTVYLATGLGWPDALAAAALAASSDAPVLLVTERGLSTPTTTALLRLEAPVLRVTGGDAVITQAVLDALEELVYE